MDKPSESKRARAGVEDFANALAKLSEKHYERDGSELLHSLRNDELARKQSARLLGVMVKQPFTVEVKRRKSKKTQSVIALRWRDEVLSGPRAGMTVLPKDTEQEWQTGFLRALAKEENPQVPDDEALRLLLQAAKYESRLGEHIFKAFRRYLCDGGPNAKSIEEAVGKAKKKVPAKIKTKSGLKRADLTVGGMKVQAASLIAFAVAHALPTSLAIYATPLVGGMAFMLLEVGLEGFCGWSAEMQKTSQASEEEDNALA
jgi:hypothetical protein